jgi:hypothetical protein
VLRRVERVLQLLVLGSSVQDFTQGYVADIYLREQETQTETNTCEVGTQTEEERLGIFRGTARKLVRGSFAAVQVSGRCLLAILRTPRQREQVIDLAFRLGRSYIPAAVVIYQNTPFFVWEQLNQAASILFD